MDEDLADNQVELAEDVEQSVEEDTIDKARLPVIHEGEVLAGELRSVERSEDDRSSAIVAGTSDELQDTLEHKVLQLVDSTTTDTSLDESSHLAAPVPTHPVSNKASDMYW